MLISGGGALSMCPGVSAIRHTVSKRVDRVSRETSEGFFPLTLSVWAR